MPKAKQPSRKTKATWRKNIDLSGVEARLENERAAERVGLAPVDEGTASGALFVEDRQGDAKVAKRVQAGKRPLRSLAILEQNKDVGAPPITSRARKGVTNATKSTSSKDTQGGLTPEQRALRSGMSRKDIEKLRRAAGREVRGAFGIIKEQEDDEAGAVQQGPEAVIGEIYDVWSTSDVPDGSAATKPAEDEVAELTKKHKPRAPATFFELRTKDVALTLPHEGQSYNPAAAAHEELLNKALRQAMEDEEKREMLLEYSRKWNSGIPQTRLGDVVTDVEAIERLLGMRVGAGDEDGVETDDEEKALEAELEAAEKEETDALSNKKKLPKRKTKQQRTRAKRVKEELRIRMQAKADRQAKAEVYKLRTLKAQLQKLEEEHLANAARRAATRQARNAERVGMRKLPVREEEVQLGEDLSDSLRGLKPEGNLLRDRVAAFQKRGMLEPKQGTSLFGKAKGGTRRQKGYETHAYKRFT